MSDIKRQPDGLFFEPDPAAVAILEKSNHEFLVAVGQVLAKLQAEIAEHGLTSVIRRVVAEGVPMELIAMLEHMHADKFQITPDDFEEPRLELWRSQAKQFLRAAIGESVAGETWPMRVNGHGHLYARPA
jgi:hypothetical protein